MPHREGMDTMMIFFDQVMIVGQIPPDMKAEVLWQTPLLDVLTLVKYPRVVASEDLMLCMVVMAWTWGLATAVAMKDQLCTGLGLRSSPFSPCCR